jgi:hypothetical protein
LKNKSLSGNPRYFDLAVPTSSNLFKKYPLFKKSIACLKSMNPKSMNLNQLPKLD